MGSRGISTTPFRTQHLGGTDIEFPLFHGDEDPRVVWKPRFDGNTDFAVRAVLERLRERHGAEGVCQSRARDVERFKRKKDAVTAVATTSGYPSHQKIMTGLTHYGEEYLPIHKIKAREKLNLMNNTRQRS